MAHHKAEQEGRVQLLLKKEVLGNTDLLFDEKDKKSGGYFLKRKN